MPWIPFKLYAHTWCIGLVFIVLRKIIIIKKIHECRVNFERVYSGTLGYLLTPQCKEGTLETTCTPARLALFHHFFNTACIMTFIKMRNQAVLYRWSRETWNCTYCTYTAANCFVLLRLSLRLAQLDTQWNGVHENLNTYSEENAQNLWSNSHFTVYVTYIKVYMMLQGHKCP
jgi:hypothetical protein